MQKHYRLFKSAGDEARYMAAYAAALKLWPVSYESTLIKTPHGRTHVLTCGPKDAFPLVLFHAGYASSTMWFPNIQSLSRDNRVLAIDTLGEPGKSVPTQSIRGKRAMANWLLCVLDELGIQQANLAGLSRGGWLATNLAIRAPERARKLCLLSPAATFVPLNRFFGLVASSAMRLRIRPVLNAALYSWVAKGFKIDPVFTEQFIIGLKTWQYPKVGIMPQAFESQELRKLSMPVCMLIGDQDRLNTGHAINRAKQMIPQIETEILPDAGHFLTMDQADLVNAKILKFLGSG